MEGPLALVTGVLFGAGIYAMMRLNLVRFTFGLILLTNAVNLLIFIMGGLVRATPPVIAPDALLPEEPFAPPLPQAMILTAIVIGLGLVVFTVVLASRSYRVLGEPDPDRMEAALPDAGDYDQGEPESGGR